MNTNNVNTLGAQEQYLGVWNEQKRIIDGLVDSASLLIRFISDEQKTEAIGQWARATFLSSKNLGIRRATIDQIKDRQDEFGADVVKILEDEYSRAVRDIPATPLRLERDDFDAEEPPRPRDTESPVRIAPSPAGQSRFTTPPRPRRYDSDKEESSLHQRRPSRKASRLSTATFSSSSQVVKLTDKVADYLRTKDFQGEYYELEYIQSKVSENPEVLKAIVSELERNPDILPERMGHFKKAVDLFIKAPKE
jgi:hypothetical protein